MNNEHIIREFEQLSLFQKKLAQIARSDSTTEKIPEIMDNLESTTIITENLVGKIWDGDTRFDEKFLTQLHHEIRTPMVPIRSYAEMLAKGNFGTLNEEQKKRLDMILASTKQLQQKMETILDKSHLHQITEKEKHAQKEDEQEKLLLKKLNELLTDEIKQDESRIQKLENSLAESAQKQKETKQEEVFLEKLVESEEKKTLFLARKNLIIIAVSAVILGVGFTAYSVYVVDLVGQQYRVSYGGNISSGYVIQNLRGDTIDTFLSWKLVPGTVLNVKVINAERYPEKIPLIKEVILSDEAIEIDDSLVHKGPKGQTSTYYVGWAGALKEASKKETALYIPSDLMVLESSSGEGHINIVLSNLKSGDGYTGYTTSIADDANNQILKSTITIFDVGNLDDEQFKTILRHELGHALGLAHSTAPEDLMHPVIRTGYPYISDCAIDTIVELYDGSKNSQVICEK